jgi:outer membrane protein TolC
MKSNFLLLIAFVCGTAAMSQKPTSGIVPGQRTRSDSIMYMDLREKLVQLAMQNPTVEIDDRNILISQYGVKKAKATIWNQIMIQGNLNEYSIQPNNTYGNLYPKYNFGASLPLGLFTTHNQDVRIARQTVNINQATKLDHYRVLREAVLTRFEDYLMAKDLLNSEKQLYEDIHTAYLKSEKDYADAKIKVEEYDRAYREDNQENAKVIVLQRDLNVAVLELERYIGVKLDDVLANYR